MPEVAQYRPGVQGVHIDELPARSLAPKVPAGHSCGESEPSEQYSPLVHGVGVWLPSPKQLYPAGHAQQAPSPGVGAYVPGGQGTGAAEPGGEYVPGGVMACMLEFAPMSQKNPASHGPVGSGVAVKAQ